MKLHEALDTLVAAYLLEHADRLPSNTTVLELIEWSARRNLQAASTEARDVEAGLRCAKCGKFLSGIRLQMRLPRCATCDWQRRPQ